MWRRWRAKVAKRVGNRQPCLGGLRQADALLRTVLALRGQRKFIPRGVYRFASFEEADEWSIAMMARR